MPALFSNCMEYEKPEQPPPTTPTRKPTGTGFCCVMISFTFATALGVREMGATFTSGVVVVGVVVVAIYLSFTKKTHAIITEALSTSPGIAERKVLSSIVPSTT